LEHHHDDEQSQALQEVIEEILQANSSSAYPRDKFLQLMLSLSPAILTLHEEDYKTTSRISCPLKHFYGFEWIPFDVLATSSPLERHPSGAGAGGGQEKIENIVTYEGVHRTERLESKSQW
jgi:hypothetical protein